MIQLKKMIEKQRKSKKLKESQGTPQKIKETQGTPEKIKENQRKTKHPGSFLRFSRLSFGFP